MNITDEIAARMRDAAGEMATWQDREQVTFHPANVLAILDDRDAKAAEIEALTARVGELERAQNISHELAMGNGAAFITASALLDKAAKALDSTASDTAKASRLRAVTNARSVLAEIEAYRSKNVSAAPGQ